jgi:hypothetical protein
MGILYQKLDIRTSELCQVRVEVAAWESPVLQAVHGENVVFVSESVLEDRVAPEAADEFARLAERYKGETEESPPFITAVYGQFGPGVSALQKAIEAATQEKGAKGIVSAAQQNKSAGEAISLEDEKAVAALI